MGNLVQERPFIAMISLGKQSEPKDLHNGLAHYDVEHDIDDDFGYCEQSMKNQRRPAQRTTDTRHDAQTESDQFSPKGMLKKFELQMSSRASWPKQVISLLVHAGAL